MAPKKSYFKIFKSHSKTPTTPPLETLDEKGFKNMKSSKQSVFESFKFMDENRHIWTDVDSNDWDLCLQNSSEFDENLKHLLP